MSKKSQRIRDPLHNLIQFNPKKFEHHMWNVIETPEFQRLRRIRQLGFSEFVYPGATHTRFSHSLGVFHTARHLMEIIYTHLHKTDDFDPGQAETAIAAALVHDVGHGMFSHSFEEVGKKLDIQMAKHEHVSGLIIRNSKITKIFDDFSNGFANNVADMIEEKNAKNIYSAVVSSQFDADRLDYMQRDRLMSGIQNSGIDFTWLKANLKIRNIATGVDKEQTGELETFVLGPKAIHAADTYVLSLFQLYPTIYFHKATRAAEKVFTALMIRLIKLAQNDDYLKTGLPKRHPIIRFAQEPNELTNVLALDDTVFWGCLSLLADATDLTIRKLAKRLQHRRLPKCIDIREELISNSKLTAISTENDRKNKMSRIESICDQLNEKYEEWSLNNSKDEPRILCDKASRSCYKKSQDSKGPLDQIRILKGKEIVDIFESSSVVRAQDTFHVFRVYVDDNDDEARNVIKSIQDDVMNKVI